MIKTFSGDDQWLSNFSKLEAPLIHGGLKYSTVEHFYVAMKTLNLRDRKTIASCKYVSDAKILGRDLTLRPNWDEQKERVMLAALRWKFSKYNPTLRQKLIDTGTQKLQEGNYWKDKYWGVYLVDGEGKNRLGILLMQVRDEIINGA
ncbi:hypothetical protein NVP1188A_79 [Vibrio phage 1.188.A._10N.286.51.A6]|uniref:NADAR domain-containing protein n=3 Tax=Mukerjeevirus mv51A6 TaxID=2734162 RepID=A0A2I7RJ43_9CAUD|nr:hypothetical protein HOU77_gp27 [Vibrio phage 1.188.A._10N.286.51.A6]AUR93647.1 hypothetical protein NVP1188A_79 [Vibrio phage 1.188.A._10N.286.51.A6]AUR93733.1 hypothetical protein NVP1188B_79 [Vibrio phage 1.188.B._10N.286.51.A6]AUR93819.1 hypothetical protein NVP1188C_79 [Vibrio phage 1.188.C._10N.286.51.A6]